MKASVKKNKISKLIKQREKYNSIKPDIQPINSLLESISASLGNKSQFDGIKEIDNFITELMAIKNEVSSISGIIDSAISEINSEIKQIESIETEEE